MILLKLTVVAEGELIWFEIVYILDYYRTEYF